LVLDQGSYFEHKKDQIYMAVWLNRRLVSQMVIVCRNGLVQGAIHSVGLSANSAGLFVKSAGILRLGILLFTF
jgi:hypothetical protein